MFRRHNGSIPVAQEALSPTKEEIRRRLFDETPQKSAKAKRKGDTLLQLSRTAIFSFVVFGVVLLLGVHGYLLRTLLLSQDNNNHAVDLHRGAVGSPTPASKNDNVNDAQQSLRRRPTPLPKRKLQALEEKDWNQYTIRINTWRRPEQLLASVDWHSKCPGVAQIQIVWCDHENEPPVELDAYENVIVERHEANNLNERFNILLPTPTLGILSIDDDVLRPCEAIDSGFFKWTQYPERMVGFDARLHVENDDGSWKYGYMSTTEKANKYSMSLTRYCFIHRDYMDIYMKELPPSILDPVAKNFNCEDVAMSFLISSLTDGKPPLLADTWAIKSMIKLYVPDKISGTHDHKHLRDISVDAFAQTLGLKDPEGSRRLRAATLYHKKSSLFDCGDVPHHILERNPKSERQLALETMIREWKDNGDVPNKIKKLMSGPAIHAFRAGLIENSDPWKERFQKPKKEDNR